MTTHQFGEVVAELNQILIRQLRLDASDQKLTVLQHGNGHAALTVAVPSERAVGRGIGRARAPLESSLVASRRALLQRDDLVTQHTFGQLDASLQVADRI